MNFPKRENGSHDKPFILNYPLQKNGKADTASHRAKLDYSRNFHPCLDDKEPLGTLTSDNAKNKHIMLYPSHA